MTLHTQFFSKETFTNLPFGSFIYLVNLRGGKNDRWLHGERNMNEWYTGLPPVYGICPGVSKNGNISSLPLPNLTNVTRQTTQNYFDNSWTLLETMFAGLKGEKPFYR